MVLLLRLTAAIMCFVAPFYAQKTEKKEVVELKLLSHFPMGGQQGTTFKVEVTGKGLQGAYAVWFEGQELTASILELKQIQKQYEKDSGKSDAYQTKAVKPDHRAVLEVQVPEAASVGLHLFRLVTPRGLSNALALQVITEAVVHESTNPHQIAGEAQSLDFPIVVNGRLSEKGERDFYSFVVSRGEELCFSVRSDLGPRKTYQADAGITLYESSASWFDPNRVVRLAIEGHALSWEPFHRYERTTSTGEFTLFQRFVHQFESSGRYFLSVGTFVGAGNPNHGYQLRIFRRQSDAPQWVLGKLAHPDPSDWMERDSATLRQLGSFRRPLQPNRLDLLQSRSGMIPENSASSVPVERSYGEGASASHPISPHDSLLDVEAEVEPNNTLNHPSIVKIPSLIEGRVQKPGDVDIFHFQATAGQRVAFELETPKISLPQFNPWLKLFDDKGNELVSNIYMEYGGDGDDVNKTVERKTIYTFEQAGNYYVQVRDLTSLQGGPNFVYRLLMRPQIPHIGRIEISLGVTPSLSTLIDKTDRINLQVGQVKEIVVVCEKEEGFEGEVALTVDNLPPGVQAWVSTAASWTETLMRGIQYRPLEVEVMTSRHHRPERNATTLLLWAGPDAPITGVPRFLHFMARPIVSGKAGPTALAGRIPFLVIHPAKKTSTLTSSR